MKTSFKTRFQIRKTLGHDKAASRIAAMLVYKKLRVMRQAAGEFINATRQAEFLKGQMNDYLPGKNHRDL